MVVGAEMWWDSLELIFCRQQSHRLKIDFEGLKEKERRYEKVLCHSWENRCPREIKYDCQSVLGDPLKLVFITVT